MLIVLISLRAVYKGLIDKKWIEWLEECTLGQMINIYMPLANRTIEEGELIKKLKEYNKLRRELIHKIENSGRQGSVKEFTEKTNKLGEEVKVILLGLIRTSYRVNR